MTKLTIVKIGGNIIENEKDLRQFLIDFSAIEGEKILVHGGGKSATAFANRLGLKPKLIDGRRITDKPNLDIAIMTYAGLLNKNIVAGLQKNNCNAIGLTGADANTIESEKRPVKTIDYGFVGDVKKVNSNNIKALILAGFTPVFCALTHNTKGQLLNTNADTVASEIAIAMSTDFEVELMYCFELQGVLTDINNLDSVITTLSASTYADFVEQGVISAGMLPKLENCFNALYKGVSAIQIGNSNMITTADTLCTKIKL